MRMSRLIPLLPVLLLCGAPALSEAAIAFGVGVSVNIAPPPLPVIYLQPPLPEPGYMWSPGYWAWDGSDYYWVPGTWVQPPGDGLLWTPGYWGWNNGLYLWNAGYWGPHVGFYGGVNYGFGYTGVGFAGGYWHGGAFFYNRAVANFGGVHVTNVYSAPVRVNVTTRVSFNGGQGGIQRQPSAEERTAMNEPHRGVTSMQAQHEAHAAAMPAMHRSQNGGHPQILTTARAGDFAHPGPAGLHNHQPGHPSGAGPNGAGRRTDFGGGAGAQSHEQGPRPEAQAEDQRGQAEHEPAAQDREQAPRDQAHEQGPREQPERRQAAHAPAHHAEAKREPEPKRDH